MNRSAKIVFKLCIIQMENYLYVWISAVNGNVPTVGYYVMPIAGSTDYIITRVTFDINT